jgi:CHAD domain-containing protein
MHKADRGFAAISQRLKPRFRKARRVPISDLTETGNALRRIMAEALDQYFANDPTEISAQAEAVHQARVAIRRLRAALRAFKAVLPYGERKAFNSEFRWLQQALGKSRDWHVFLTETLPAIPGLEEHERTALQSLATARQSKYLKSGVKTMASRRTTRLLLHFQLWLQ